MILPPDPRDAVTIPSFPFRMLVWRTSLIRCWLYVSDAEEIADHDRRPPCRFAKRAGDDREVLLWEVEFDSPSALFAAIAREGRCIITPPDPAAKPGRQESRWMLEFYDDYRE